MPRIFVPPEPLSKPRQVKRPRPARGRPAAERGRARSSNDDDDGAQALAAPPPAGGQTPGPVYVPFPPVELPAGQRSPRVVVAAAGLCSSDAPRGARSSTRLRVRAAAKSNSSGHGQQASSAATGTGARPVAVPYGPRAIMTGIDADTGATPRVVTATAQAPAPRGSGTERETGETALPAGTRCSQLQLAVTAAKLPQRAGTGNSREADSPAGETGASVPSTTPRVRRPRQRPAACAPAIDAACSKGPVETATAGRQHGPTLDPDGGCRKRLPMALVSLRDQPTAPVATSSSSCWRVLRPRSPCVGELEHRLDQAIRMHDARLFCLPETSPGSGASDTRGAASRYRSGVAVPSSALGSPSSSRALTTTPVLDGGVGFGAGNTECPSCCTCARDAHCSTARSLEIFAPLPLPQAAAGVQLERAGPLRPLCVWQHPAAIAPRLVGGPSLATSESVPARARAQVASDVDAGGVTNALGLQDFDSEVILAFFEPARTRLARKPVCGALHTCACDNGGLWDAAHAVPAAPGRLAEATLEAGRKAEIAALHNLFVGEGPGSRPADSEVGRPGPARTTTRSSYAMRMFFVQSSDEPADEPAYASSAPFPVLILDELLVSEAGRDDRVPLWHSPWPAVARYVVDDVDRFAIATLLRGEDGPGTGSRGALAGRFLCARRRIAICEGRRPDNDDDDGDRTRTSFQHLPQQGRITITTAPLGFMSDCEDDEHGTGPGPRIHGWPFALEEPLLPARRGGGCALPHLCAPLLSRCCAYERADAVATVPRPGDKSRSSSLSQPPPPVPRQDFSWGSGCSELAVRTRLFVVDRHISADMPTLLPEEKLPPGRQRFSWDQATKVRARSLRTAAALVLTGPGDRSLVDLASRGGIVALPWSFPYASRARQSAAAGAFVMDGLARALCELKPSSSAWANNRVFGVVASPQSVASPTQLCEDDPAINEHDWLGVPGEAAVVATTTKRTTSTTARASPVCQVEERVQQLRAQLGAHGAPPPAAGSGGARDDGSIIASAIAAPGRDSGRGLGSSLCVARIRRLTAWYERERGALPTNLQYVALGSVSNRVQTAMSAAAAAGATNADPGSGGRLRCSPHSSAGGGGGFGTRGGPTSDATGTTTELENYMELVGARCPEPDRPWGGPPDRHQQQLAGGADGCELQGPQQSLVRWRAAVEEVVVQAGPDLLDVACLINAAAWAEADGPLRRLWKADLCGGPGRPLADVLPAERAGSLLRRLEVGARQARLSGAADTVLDLLRKVHAVRQASALVRATELLAASGVVCCSLFLDHVPQQLAGSWEGLATLRRHLRRSSKAVRDGLLTDHPKVRALLQCVRRSSTSTGGAAEPGPDCGSRKSSGGPSCRILVGQTRTALASIGAALAGAGHSFVVAPDGRAAETVLELAASSIPPGPQPRTWWVLAREEDVLPSAHLDWGLVSILVLFEGLTAARPSRRLVEMASARQVRVVSFPASPLPAAWGGAGAASASRARDCVPGIIGAACAAACVPPLPLICSRSLLAVFAGGGQVLNDDAHVDVPRAVAAEAVAQRHGLKLLPRDCGRDINNDGLGTLAYAVLDAKTCAVVWTAPELSGGDEDAVGAEADADADAQGRLAAEATGCGTASLVTALAHLGIKYRRCHLLVQLRRASFLDHAAVPLQQRLAASLAPGFPVDVVLEHVVGGSDAVATRLAVLASRCAGRGRSDDDDDDDGPLSCANEASAATACVTGATHQARSISERGGACLDPDGGRAPADAAQDLGELQAKSDSELRETASATETFFSAFRHVNPIVAQALEVVAGFTPAGLLRASEQDLTDRTAPWLDARTRAAIFRVAHGRSSSQQPRPAAGPTAGAALEGALQASAKVTAMRTTLHMPQKRKADDGDSCAYGDSGIFGDNVQEASVGGRLVALLPQVPPARVPQRRKIRKIDVLSSCPDTYSEAGQQASS